MPNYRTLIRPLQTEKATNLSQKGKYLFVVLPDANKVAIKQAFFELYSVMPMKVNILKTPKKTKTVAKGRSSAKRPERKKAIITLKTGKTIDVYKVRA